MMRPAVFFWYAGRLYVGYDDGDGHTQGHEPRWDPVPIPVGAIIETCGGVYHFQKVLKEGAPYFREYAVLSLRYNRFPNDYREGNMRKRLDQGKVAMSEQVVLDPTTYLEWQRPSRTQGYLIDPHNAKVQIAYERQYDKNWKLGLQQGLGPAQIKDTPMRHQHYRSDSRNLMHRWDVNPHNVIRRIKRSASLEYMRSSKESANLRNTKYHPLGCMHCGKFGTSM